MESTAVVLTPGEAPYPANDELEKESSEAFRRIRLQQIFFRSVIQNDQAMVIRCLHHGADVAEEYTPHYQTVLHESSKRGLLRMTELLLRAGANPNAVDQKAFLPLHYACQEGHFNTVRCLLIYGSMVTVENEYGDAPVHTAVRYGHADLLPLLLSVDLSRDFDRRRVPDRYQGVEHLNLQNANGDTCLHIAAALDRKPIVKRLLQWAADPSLINHQGLTPLQVAIEKQRPAVVRLLRHPPLIVYERPFGLLNMSPNQKQHQQFQQQQQHPFKNFDGLQRYTDEVARHRLEHEGSSVQQPPLHPRAYMEPMVPKAMSTESLSQVSRGQQSHNYFVRGDSNRGTSVPSISPSDPGRLVNGGRISSPNQIGVMPTKIVELDAQPNNVNREINGLGPRSKTTLVGDYHYARRNQPHQQYLNGATTFAPLPSASMRDLTIKTPVIPGPGADVLFGDKAAQTSFDMHNNNDDTRRTEKVDRRLDALSLEVDEKLRELRSQYSRQQHQVDAATTTTTTTSERYNGVGSGGRRASKSKSKREKRSSSSPKSTPSSTSSVKTSRISVTYENGRITNLSTNGDTIIETRTASGFIPVQNDKRNQRSPTPPPPAAPTDETDRRMSHTFYVPPAPKAPEPHDKNYDDRVIIVRDLNSQDKLSGSSEAMANGRHITISKTPKELREEEQEHYLNTSVTDVQNGKRIIRQAPTLTDVYNLRVGRVSPRIRSLQDKLRRSHYRNANYNYALYDDAGYHNDQRGNSQDDDGELSEEV